MISPVLVLNDAPLGSAGLTDHVTGPLAHAPSVAEGVTVSVDCSCTVCGSVIAATDTVPALCVTSILNGLLVPNSTVAAVAVSLNAPSPPSSYPTRVRSISPVLVLNDAPVGSAGLTDHVTGPVAHAPSVALGVTVSVDCSSTVCGSVIAATDTVPALCVTLILKA